VATAVTSATVLAQVLPPDASVSVRSWSEANSCANAPLRCEGAADTPIAGTYEFDFYEPEWGPIDTLRFGVEYPQDWRPISVELCRGQLLSGDPLSNPANVTFQLSCDAEPMGPFMRLLVECSSPGTFQLRSHAGSDRGPEWHSCDWDKWESWTDEAHVEIGDFCGRNSLGSPCNRYCTVGLCAHFAPGSIDVSVAPDGTVSDTVLVIGSSDPKGICGGRFYCGGSVEFGAPAFAELRANSPWVRVRHLKEVDQFYHYYLVTIDASSLPIGTHHARLVAVTGCSSYYTDNCAEVVARVAVVPTSTRSWSSLKGTFR
jgi:hypothetical protein